MIIYNNNMNNVKLSRNLPKLLGIGSNLLFVTYVKQLTSPSTYFIHCDLVDKKAKHSQRKTLNRLGQI